MICFLLDSVPMLARNFGDTHDIPATSFSPLQDPVLKVLYREALSVLPRQLYWIASMTRGEGGRFPDLQGCLLSFGHGSKLNHQELGRRLDRPWFHLPIGPPILTTTVICFFAWVQSQPRSYGVPSKQPNRARKKTPSGLDQKDPGGSQKQLKQVTQVQRP